MSKTNTNSTNWKRQVVRTLGIMVLFALLALHTAQSAPRAQIELQAMAAQSPNSIVSVIVQKVAPDSELEQRIVQAGGAIDQDLHIINAFSAHMAASSAVALANDPAVKWVSLDASMRQSGGPDGSLSTSSLVNAYNKAVNADDVWGDGYQGSSVTVAVVDTGVGNLYDLRSSLSNPGGSSSRLVQSVEFVSGATVTLDDSGHGTHVAGIIAGNGANGGAKYIGIAPKAKLISVKVANQFGLATTSDVVAGLQWINDNRVAKGIKVVNISMNGILPESYNVSPLDAACEILWFNGVVVVVSAGNAGINGLNPPANDPFVITVGAVDDKGTASRDDDVLAPFSPYGTTGDGFSKPDLVAPGRNIVSSMFTNNNSQLATSFPANVVSTYYFRMSGTSMAAPVVSGAAALLLQTSPSLNPDQVKYRLKTTGRAFAYGNGAPYLDVKSAMHSSTATAANTHVAVSNLLNTGSSPVGPLWGSVNWGSVNWGSVNWGSVNWGSVNWGSVNWASDYWE